MRDEYLLDFIIWKFIGKSKRLFDLKNLDISDDEYQIQKDQLKKI